MILEKTSDKILVKLKSHLLETLRLIEKIRSIIQIRLLICVSRKSMILIDNEISVQIEELKTTGILSNANEDRNTIMDLHKMWQTASRAFTLGNFQESVDMRTACLERLYDLQGIDISSDYYPPLIGDGYTGSIGHLALYFLHQECRGYELHLGSRYLLKPSSVANNPFFDFLSNCDVSIPLAKFNSTNSLALSSLVENLEIVRSKGGFLSIYILAEKHGLRQFRMNQNRRLEFQKRVKLVTDYWEVASQELESLGLNLEEPFVVLHVRGLKSRDLRGASPQNFIPSIEYLLREGIQVVRVGSRESQLSGFTSKGFFDLSNQNSSIHLLLFLLLNCKALIGTQSGLSMAALMLSCPSLITNTIAIGRNTFSFPQTIYLPKIMTEDGESASLERYLSPEIGFADATEGFLRSRNIELRENSKSELLVATKEFISGTLANSWNLIDWEECELNRKRKQWGAVTLGKLSENFIHGIKSD